MYIPAARPTQIFVPVIYSVEEDLSYDSFCIMSFTKNSPGRPVRSLI